MKVSNTCSALTWAYLYTIALENQADNCFSSERGVALRLATATT